MEMENYIFLMVHFIQAVLDLDKLKVKVYLFFLMVHLKEDKFINPNLMEKVY